MAHSAAVTHVHRLDNLGVDTSSFDAINEARTLTERQIDLAELASRVWAGDDDRARVARGIASGELDHREAFLEALRLDQTIRHRASRYVEDAAAIVDRQVAQRLAKIGDAWVTDIIRPAVIEALEPLPELAAKIGPGWMDVNIMKCNEPAVVNAFAQVSAIDDRLVVLRGFLAGLNGDQEPQTPRICPLSVVSLRRPELFTRDPGMPVWSLCEAQRSGAEPGIWLASEVVTSSKRRTAA